MISALPVDAVLPSLADALREAGAAVLVAAPGAGKSTRVAPFVQRQTEGTLLMLQPRRLAARTVAARIAHERGEALGHSVGYQVRHDTVGTAQTRLWVLTEGILTRRLHRDPYLEGVSTVILDEFHERSLHVDVAIAWLAELRRTVRPDLQIVVMSATIAAEPIAAFLGDCPVIRAEGRCFPVAIHYQEPPPRMRCAEAVAQGVRRALVEVSSGDVLAFLPGVGEIHGCAAALADCDAEIIPLHGSLPAAEQDRALASYSRRKVVLATNVAETSLTIDGVTAVVDSGLHRVDRFDPERGLPVLRSEQISRWNAEQRSGRAGRTAPGWCLRLWSRLNDARLSEAPSPAIEHADLAPLCCDLRSIHGDDVRSFPWLTPPPAEALAGAEELLHLLGMTTGPFGPLTPRGRYLSGLPIHPRLARLLLAAEEEGVLPLAAAVAAILSERSLLRRDVPRPGRARWADVEDELYLLARGPRHPSVHGGAWQQVAAVREDLLRQWGASASGPSAMADIEHQETAAVLPRLLLAAFPDRVARRSSAGSNRLRWAGGAGEVVAGSVFYCAPGRSGDALCVAYGLRGLGGRGRQATLVDGAAIIDRDTLQAVHPEAFNEAVECVWNTAKERVETARVQRFGSVVLAYEANAGGADAAQVAALLKGELIADWDRQLARFPRAQAWLARLHWCMHHCPEVDLPAGTVDDCASLWVGDCRGFADLRDPYDLLRGQLTYEQQRALDTLAPAALTLPNGQQRDLDYRAVDQAPTLRLRIQQCFGWRDGPRVAAGRCAVRLELCAPNDRPQQICDDLAGFWAGSYALVRKDLRGRYPKHPWPEDPASAPPIPPRRR